jgi:hypothetical protein
MRHAQLSWKALTVLVAVGLLVVVLTWLAGPRLMATGAARQGTVVTAEVTLPMPCSAPGAQETVRFPFGGKTRDGTLDACGHNPGERVEVEVPPNAGDGVLPVAAAETAVGSRDLSRPVSLFLVALSCFAGASYVYLVQRGPRRLAPA